MRLLLITVAYPPYIFSESLCNAKLVLNLQKYGIHVDVISRQGMGPAYSGKWAEPWTQLRENLYEISYERGGVIARFIDVLVSSVRLRCDVPIEGIRWARRALELALKKHQENPYDAVLTRSPSDIPHLVGRAMHRKTGVKWLANWNDPAVTIWPAPYSKELRTRFTRKYNAIVQSCINEASVNTFPSEQLLKHFQKYFKTNNAAVVPHVQLPDDLFKRRVHEKNTVFTMCHAGNLSTERNPRLLFLAIKEAMDFCGGEIRLHIMGQYSKQLEELAEASGVKSNIQFVGACEYMESLKKLQGYDALVLLEAEMDCGIFAPSKLTDYAQCERPLLLISPPVGYARDIAENCNICVHVDNHNVSDIAQGIIRLYKEWQGIDCSQNSCELSISAGYAGHLVTGLYQKLLTH